jgi:hypothetical protein
LNLEQIAEAHVRDDTATRAFSAVPIKSADGKCLSINPLGGDPRQNLIPVDVKACDGSAGQQFDIITAGKHNDQAGTMLVVSALVSCPIQTPCPRTNSGFLARLKAASTLILAALRVIRFSCSPAAVAPMVVSRVVTS